MQTEQPDAPGYFQVSQRLKDWVAGQKNTDEDQQDVAEAAETDSSLETLDPDAVGEGLLVKSQEAEQALPEFNLAKVVGSRIRKQGFRQAVLLCVVDLADFDGSLPRLALQALLQASGTKGTDLRLVIAANKVDLLPKQAVRDRLERWVRQRCRQGGIPPPTSVHLVSSLRRHGVRELLQDLQALAGPRSDVYVIGAQNAGKSSLLNAMRRTTGQRSQQTMDEITAAPLPGTTLDMLEVRGLLSNGSKVWDTPGVPHKYQLPSNLSPDEVRMLLPRRQIKPRTFRTAPGQTVFIGGLARIDVLTAPGPTLYLTVWASDEVVCHFAKTEGAEQRYEDHVGSKLAPPLGDKLRVDELGPLAPKHMTVEGRSWRESAQDAVIAGLGWVGVGLKGIADLRVWAHEGVAISQRFALLPDMAQNLEKPGFGNRDMKPKLSKGSKKN
eukprot:jgi/Astpho2/9751/fgenesh1_pm.00149_%23_16_t